MLLAVIKVLGMLYPFLKEAYLTKNKYKRNKTIITLTVIAVIMLLFMTAAIDTTYTLYKQNKEHQEEMLKLKAQLNAKSTNCDDITTILVDINKRIEAIAPKTPKR